MKMINFIIFLSITASGCSTFSYSVAHQNISDEMICVEKGVWESDIRGSGCIAGFTEEKLFPVQRVHGDIRQRMPESIGVVWRNIDDDVIEEYIRLDKLNIPKLLRGEKYKFVVSLSQQKIHQVEVIVISSENIRKKKIKSMLYCSEGEGLCDFMTPFTTDYYYDPDKLTEAQKNKLEKKSEIMADFKAGLKKDLEEKGIEHKFSDE